MAGPSAAAGDCQYPVNLVVAGRRCLVVGGGRVAVRKVAGLHACGAQVHVVAPSVASEIKQRAGVTWDERPYCAADLAGCRLVIAATDDAATNETVYADAEAAGIWVNGADDPAHCSFTLPSVVRRGPLLLTVSTGGRSPALATWLRRRLEAEVGPEYETLLELVSSARRRLQSDGRSTEAFDWQKALDSDMLGLIRRGDLDTAQERLQTCLSSSSD